MYRSDIKNNINESLIKKESKLSSYISVLPVIFLYFTVIFGCSPLVQQIHIDQICIDFESDDCTSVEVSKAAANLNLAASCALNIPAILMSGFYGAFADKYGRKSAMFCPMLGLTIWTSIYYYVDQYNSSYYHFYIILANFLMGLSGNFIAFIMASLCYVSDSTQSIPHTRRTAYSVTEATIFAPQIFGPVATGLYAAAYGFQIPVLLSAFLCVFSIFYLSFLPESLSLDAECRNFALKFDPLKTFKNILYLFNHKCDNGKSPLPYIGSSFLLFFSSAMGGVSVRIIYFKHEFDWSPGDIGVYAGLEGVVIVLSMLLAPVFLKAFIGRFLKVITFIQVGYFFRLVHYCLFGLIRESMYLYCIIPLLFFVGPVGPYTRTILSNTVKVEEQAKIFSAFSAIEGLGALVGPMYNVIFSFLLDKNISWVIWEIIAFFACLAFLIILYVRSNSEINNNLPNEEKLLHLLEKKSDDNIIIEEEEITTFLSIPGIDNNIPVIDKKTRSVSVNNQSDTNILHNSENLNLLHSYNTDDDDVVVM